MPIHFSRPDGSCAPPAEGDKNSITVKIRSELARFVTYCFFWTFCLLAIFVTKIWVQPFIEGGAAAAGEPPERLGCGPFNRDNDILGNSETFNLKFGDGFTFEESHLVEAFGFGNICTYWDYTPATEVTALYFPFFEYSLVLYLFLDFVSTMMSYRRGLLPTWYWRLMQIFTPINMLLSAWFRMIFVAKAYDHTAWHTAGFLGLQCVLINVAVMNVLYVLMTGQSYPSLGWSKSVTATYAKWYIVLNLAISSVKIYATYYIVFISPTNYSPDFYKAPAIFGLVLGRVIDYIWMFFNAVVPAIIAWFRMKDERPLEITVSVPAIDFEPEGAPSETDRLTE